MRVRYMILLALVGVMVPCLAQAQHWCPPGATWEYQVIGSGSDGCGIATYDGDTLVAGRTAQRIVHRDTVRDYLADTTYTYLYAEHTSYDTGIVHLYLPMAQAWDTLYWLGAVPGDRWYPPGVQPDDNGCPPPGGMVQVVDTGTAEINGVLLRFIDAHYLGHDGAPVGAAMRIHERIGSHSVGLPPGGCVIGEWPYILFTYTDAVGTAYDTGRPDLCRATSEVSEISDECSIVPYPNPGTDRIRFSEAIASFTMELHDLFGRMVLTRDIPDPGQGVDVSEVSAGVYLMRLHIANGYAIPVRWVKE